MTFTMIGPALPDLLIEPSAVVMIYVKHAAPRELLPMERAAVWTRVVALFVGQLTVVSPANRAVAHLGAFTGSIGPK